MKQTWVYLLGQIFMALLIVTFFPEEVAVLQHNLSSEISSLCFNHEYSILALSRYRDMCLERFLPYMLRIKKVFGKISK